MGKNSLYKSYNRKKTLLFLCSAIFTLALLASLVYFYISVCIDNNTSKISSNINSIITYDTSSRESLDNFIVSFSSNEKVIDIFTSNESEISTPNSFEISSQIMQFQSISPEFENIYLYNGKNMYNCINMHNVSLEHFPNELTEELKKTVNQRKNILISGDTSQNRKLYLIFSHTYSNINNAIVVCLDDSDIDSYMSFENQYNLNLIVTNKYGDIIYSEENSECQIGRNINDTKLLNESKISNNGEYMVTKFKDKKSLLYLFPSKISNKNYYIITPYSDAIKPINNKNNYPFICICILVVIMLFFVFSITLKYYRLLKKKTFISFEEYESETRKNHNITSIFKSNDYPESIAIKLKEVYGESTCVVTYIKIENLADLKQIFYENTLHLYGYSIDNVLRELTSELGYDINCLKSENEQISYIITGISELTYIKNLKTVFETLISTSDEIGGNISVYVSVPFQPSEFAEKNSNVLKLFNYRFFCKKNTVLFEEEILLNIQNSIHSDYAVKFQELLNSISAPMDTILLTNKSFFHSLIKLEYAMVRDLLVSCFFQLCNQISDYTEKNALKIKITMVDYITKITSSDNIYETEKIYEELLTSFRNQLSNLESNLSKNILQRCSDIINSDFSDPLLTPDTISKELGFSQGHLSKKLKSEYNVSLSNLIKERRLQEAAKLLVETNLNVSEIIDKCGFTDKSYFTVIFKNKYNTTPSAFRKSHKIN